MKEKDRQDAMDAQKEIDVEVAKYYASERDHERKELAAKKEHKRLLDKVLEDRKREEKRRREKEIAEVEEMEVFAAAKRVSYTRSPTVNLTSHWCSHYYNRE